MKMRSARINPHWLDKATPCEETALRICLYMHMGKTICRCFCIINQEEWPLVERYPPPDDFY